jgi:hypothetical protein
MTDTIFYIGEIGRVVSLSTGVDWTSPVTKVVKFTRPDGTSVSFTGSEVTVDDAATGTIHVISRAGDFNQSGRYLVQAKLITASATLYGPITSINVDSVL